MEHKSEEELVNYNGKQIRKIITNDYEFFYASDVEKVLNIKNIRQVVGLFSASETVDNEQRRLLNINTYKIHRNKKVIDNKIMLLTEQGMERVLSRSRSHKADDLAKFLNINVYNRFTPIETETIKNITEAFKNHHYELQYSPEGVKYRIDLYFTDLKIAIECDENGHKDRDPDYEKQRQETLEKILGCKFIRYNPHDSKFNIFTLINEIYTAIMLKNINN